MPLQQLRPCCADTQYLTRFLRARGFDLTEACETFKKFVKTRDTYPHCYKRLDVLDPGISDLMGRGYLFPLWERDSLGRTVIFGRGAMFNQKFGHRPSDLFRAVMMTVETLLDDDENQRNGFVYIFDQEGVCLSEVTYLGVFELQKLVRSGEVRIAPLLLQTLPSSLAHHLPSSSLHPPFLPSFLRLFSTATFTASPASLLIAIPIATPGSDPLFILIPRLHLLPTIQIRKHCRSSIRKSIGSICLRSS